MSQLPILEPKVSCSEIHPNKVTQFSSFFFILPSLSLNGSSFFKASQGSAIHVFLVHPLLWQVFLQTSLFLAGVSLPLPLNFICLPGKCAPQNNLVKGPASGISRDTDFSKQSPVVRRLIGLIGANPWLNFKLGLFFF